MPEEKKETPEAPVVENTRSVELEAAREISEFGKLLGAEDVAKRAIAEGKSLAEFKEMVRAAQPETVKGPVAKAEDVAERNGGKVELARTLPRFGKLKAFQGEGAEERAYRFGKFLLGGPGGKDGSEARRYCSEHGITLKRAMSEAVNEKGGYLVPEEFGNDMIDLVEKYGVFRQNAKIVPMASETRSDPRIVGELTAYAVQESNAGTDDDFEVDRVALTAKKWLVLAPYSSEISEDATISMADTIAMLAARAFAKKEDDSGFNGDGTSTYHGIVGAREKLKGLSGTIANIAGLQVATGTGYATNYASTVLADFEGVVGRLPEYADSDAAAWYVHRSYYWNVMVKAMLAVGGVTAAEVEDSRKQRFMGYRVVFSQVMPKASAVSQVCALFGDLAEAASLGDRREYSFAISSDVRFREDDLVFKARSRTDINVHDVGNADASAALQVPGPLVGLITAAS